MIPKTWITKEKNGTLSKLKAFVLQSIHTINKKIYVHLVKEQV